MHPTLFTIEAFGREIPYYSYGAMLAIAFLVGAALASWNGRSEGVSSERVITLSILILISAMLGGRVLHVLMADNPGGGILSAQNGGFAFYGGLMGGIAVSLVYCRYHQIPFLRMADTMVPSIALGQGFGRLGCLLAGCCWGRAAEAPLPDWLPGVAGLQWPQSLAITFMHPDSLAQRGIAVVPTQIASSLSCFLIFAVLWFWVRPRKTFVGQQLASYLLMYPVLRSFWELFRGDPRGLYLGETLSTSQLVGVPMFALGLWLLWRGRKQAAASSETTGSS
jgi:phosphatidylglycerol:prolipoprotein diacylglycerol transferase